MTNMEKLKDPPEGLETCGDTIQSFFERYLVIVDLAFNPKGDLTEYTASLNHAGEVYNAVHAKIWALEPEKRRE